MKIQPYFNARDLWIGVYKTPVALYVGYLPTLGIRVTLGDPRAVDEAQALHELRHGINPLAGALSAAEIELGLSEQKRADAEQMVNALQAAASGDLSRHSQAISTAMASIERQVGRLKQAVEHQQDIANQAELIRAEATRSLSALSDWLNE